MTDNTDDEHLDNPTNTQSENSSDQIILTTNTDPITQIQETENMEVHKHPHHVTHKKKWGEYFLEFLMLFLAVFLGFVAENIREDNVEKSRAVKFAKNLLSDLKKDTTEFSVAIKQQQTNSKGIDTLIHILR